MCLSPTQFFGFIWPINTKDFRRYNWTRLTTVAWQVRGQAEQYTVQAHSLIQMLLLDR